MSVIVNGRFLAKPMSGVVRFALELTTRLALRQEITIAVPPGTVPPEHLRSLCQPLGSGSGYLWEQVHLRRRVQGSADVLWSPANTGPLVANQLITIHDLFAIEHPEWVSRRFHWTYRALLPRLARRAAGISTVSDYSASRIRAVLGVDAPIGIVPNGIDERYLHATPDRRIESRYGIHGPYGLVLGSLEPRKNLPAIAAAWSSIQDRYPGTRPVLAGGQGAAQVFRSAGELRQGDSVLTPGFIRDEHLPALYAGASAFVCASHAEGFGITPLEAAVAGAPVVVSGNSGLREVCGQFGIMVDPAVPESIAAGISQALDGHGRATDRRRLAAQYSWDSALDCLERALDTAGDRSGRCRPMASE